MNVNVTGENKPSRPTEADFVGLLADLLRFGSSATASYGYNIKYYIMHV